jgi:hypothetical protein
LPNEVLMKEKEVMDNIILIIVGLISGYYIYRKLFKSTTCNQFCKSCRLCNFCQIFKDNKGKDK